MVLLLNRVKIAMNNIFLSTTFSPDEATLSSALDICKDNRLNSIEIGSNHCFEEDYDYLFNYDFKYLVHNYFPIPEKTFVLNVASSDNEIFQRSISHICNSIDFCERIGAELYTFHPGFLIDPRGSNISNENYDFQWDSGRLASKNYEGAWERMIAAVCEVARYARGKKVKLAIETEGSFYQRNHLLMQKPEEYERWFKLFSLDEIGVNLNIGHLNLATKAFNFKREDFIDLIADYVVAMELSHNDGIEDQHLPLEPDGWYWPLIQDERFRSSFKILEFRNSDINQIKRVLTFFET